MQTIIDSSQTTIAFKSYQTIHFPGHIYTIERDFLQVRFLFVKVKGMFCNFRLTGVLAVWNFDRLAVGLTLWSLLSNRPNVTICLTLSREGILKALQTIKVNKGSRPDEIPPIFLRSFAESLVTPLSQIF